uniref:Uncharacterized protein n=1 Tax=Knipowitschia caucasica TaxID=637954 RepID=A0AAV2IQ30_KNICA
MQQRRGGHPPRGKQNDHERAEKTAPTFTPQRHAEDRRNGGPRESCVQKGETAHHLSSRLPSPPPIAFIVHHRPFNRRLRLLPGCPRPRVRPSHPTSAPFPQPLTS